MFVLLKYFNKHECGTIKLLITVSIGNNLYLLNTQIYLPINYSPCSRENSSQIEMISTQKQWIVDNGLNALQLQEKNT